MIHIPSLGIEGDDGAGKQTVTLATAVELLENTDRPVVFISHPNYYGTGQFIKGMNRGNAADLFESLSGIEQTTLRCAAFALDRLFSLAILKQSLLENPDAIVIADRGPDSNAVTLGVMLGNGIITKDDIPQLIEDVLPSVDKEIRSQIDFQSILCTPDNISNTAIGDGGREALDNYESMQDRNPISQIYRQIITTEPVITRVGGEWRDPYQISSDILSRFQLDIIDFPEGPPEEKLVEYASAGRFIAAGPKLFVRTLFGANAVHFMSPGLRNRISNWERFTFMNPIGENKGKDLLLDEFEKKISVELIELMGLYPEVNPNIDKTVITGFKRLLQEHPLLPELITQSLGTSALPLVQFIQKIINLGEES